MTPGQMVQGSVVVAVAWRGLSAKVAGAWAVWGAHGALSPHTSIRASGGRHSGTRRPGCRCGGRYLPRLRPPSSRERQKGKTDRRPASQSRPNAQGPRPGPMARQSTKRMDRGARVQADWSRRSFDRQGRRSFVRKFTSDGGRRSCPESCALWNACIG